MTATIASTDDIRSRRRIMENFVLIWLDASIDTSEQDYQQNMLQLRGVVNDVNRFTEQNEAVDFLTDVDNTKACLIVNGTIGQQIIPFIHNIPQLDTVYILCDSKSEIEQWTKDWVKIKGIHTNIESIYKALRLVVKQCDHDSIAVSFVTMDEETPTVNLNQLEPSFMYTQIFKEILLEIEYNQQSIKNFTQFWRDHYVNNPFTLKIISEFERDYCSRSTIKWYTKEYFIYHMLNRALRMLDADTLIHMGFFIRDLHTQIEALHREQVNSYHNKPLTVYRGQGLSITDFEKLQKTKNGLLSFNNFLSTSPNTGVSRGFAESASTNTDTVGVLFKITINPSISSAPFASIQHVSYFQEEEEILFTMHSVFRVGEITTLDNTSSLYQVDLQLTADDDKQLRTLTECIRSDVSGEKGWQRLGYLLTKLNHFDKAEELYNALLEQAVGLSQKAIFYNNLGFTKNGQGDYSKAIEYHKKALEMLEKKLPPNHCDLAPFYHNIGRVYFNIGDYSKALSYYEIGLSIRQETLPSNHSDLATSYSCIGAVCKETGQYSKALLYYEKALKIRQNTLPENHPDLANNYGNIGAVHQSMGEYSKALLFNEKALKIRQNSLPSDHPDLASSYNNLGLTYFDMGDYRKALSLCEKALDIRQKTLAPNHFELAATCNNIGGVYGAMRDYANALSFYKRALDIFQQTLPENHSTLAACYNNIGFAYNYMGERQKAILLYGKALEIWQKTLPSDHPRLAVAYNNMGSTYNEMGEYSKALSFHRNALEIQQKNLPNHSDVAYSFNNIGLVYTNKRAYSKALSHFERALNIFQSSLPPNHPDIQIVKTNIERMKCKL